MIQTIMKGLTMKSLTHLLPAQESANRFLQALFAAILIIGLCLPAPALADDDSDTTDGAAAESTEQPVSENDTSKTTAADSTDESTTDVAATESSSSNNASSTAANKAADSSASSATLPSTFTYKGVKYQVADENECTAKIIGVDGSGAYDLSVFVPYITEGNEQITFEVIDIDPDAFKGVRGTFVTPASFAQVNNAQTALSRVATDAKLMLELDDEVTLNSKGSFAYSEYGGTTTTFALENNRAFDEFRITVKNYFSVTNATQETIDLIPYVEDDASPAFPLEPNATLSFEDLSFTADALELQYRDAGGQWQTFEDQDYNTSRQMFGQLPAGVDRTNPITVRLVPKDNERPCYVSTDLPNDQIAVDMSKGPADFAFNLSSTIFQNISTEVNVHLSFTEADNAVWIDGVYHDAPYSADGVTLDYVDGKPILTLDGALIDTVDESENGYGHYGIASNTDLTVNLKNESTITVDADVPAGCISVDGALTINSIGDAKLNSILVCNKSMQSLMPRNISANSFTMNGGTLTVSMKGSSVGGSDSPTIRGLVSAIYAKGDINLNTCYVATLSDEFKIEGTSFGLDADGSIALSDTKYISNTFNCAAHAEGDLDITGASSLNIATAVERRPSALYAGGTFKADLANDGKRHSIQVNEGNGPAVAANSIELAKLTLISQPLGSYIGEFTDFYNNTAETFLTPEGDEADELVLSIMPLEGNKFDAVFAGTATDEFIKQAIWNQVLHKEGPYAGSYILTKEDEEAIYGCTSLDIALVGQHADFSDSSISLLASLENISVTTDAAYAGENDFTHIVGLPTNLNSISVNAQNSNGSLAVEGVNTSAKTPLSLAGFDNLKLLDLSNVTLPQTFDLSGMHNAKNVRLLNTLGVNDMVAPDTDKLEKLYLISTTTSNLTVPEASRASLTKMVCIDNRLSDLDLEGVTLDKQVFDFDYYPDDSSKQYERASFTVMANEDGTVTIDLAKLFGDRLMKIESSCDEAVIDEEAGTITFPSADAARAACEAGQVTYRVDTMGKVAQSDGDPVAAYLPVIISELTVNPYQESTDPSDPTPGDPSVTPPTDNEPTDDDAKDATDTSAKTNDAIGPLAIGIGVVAALAVIVLGASIYFMRRRR